MNFTNKTFKDFENIPEMDINERSEIFTEYLSYVKYDDQQTYRVIATSGCNSKIKLKSQFGDEFISYVSNDYLGFTQHPQVKKAAIEGILKYGTGAGASPLIGGFFDYHNLLEEKIASFFGYSSDSSVIFTTGYTANSASLQALLQKEDVAILDSGVHTSVHEGCILTNKKTFPHNNIEALERILQQYQNKFRTKMVVVDGIYSQDGDTAPLKEILTLCRKYGAYLMVDDAHGIGVTGNTGRGVLERDNIIKEVDFITGTFSKSFGNIGGFVICSPKNAKFLKFQSKQQIFSATAGASTLGIVKAIELIDQEPQWLKNLQENIRYFNNGLKKIGIELGERESAIFPIKIGDDIKTLYISKELMKKGIYTNPILYPAVSRGDSRIRMSLSAVHTKQEMDYTLSTLSELI
ncbi:MULTISPECIES: aminotransferase class I/II-fold pyridoxal phosphate-dependent enzyme [Sphingobacterium]|uniref:Aminotransferase class I/II-fold pyridoxal phosphate-dependent enzyme n=1 Tax=Sphingobacterium litopenaei TaxID=2763500 RepID=A0ABR7YBT1_9SPHI|nr:MULTISPECIES: aminotransferase class I/II-fold pyridoxal phosphate-dependent enzyme [Sphingobacterium]MBD1428749.1 aminotransferase class I/II-fold pyridoxal phosphate-dependent enzyme [Sphingobacterium litopenaei]NGM74490.1 aminotransferase class I/II-fold pyridoxal phosphate-dependent enzyme [Sphingobacterium sp. SGL-16]